MRLTTLDIAAQPFRSTVIARLVWPHELRNPVLELRIVRLDHFSRKRSVRVFRFFDLRPIARAVVAEATAPQISISAWLHGRRQAYLSTSECREHCCCWFCWVSASAEVTSASNSRKSIGARCSNSSSAVAVVVISASSRSFAERLGNQCQSCTGRGRRRDGHMY